MKEPLSAPHLYVFMSTKKKKKIERKKNKKKCKKVDRKLERAVYTKGEPKEREREKI